MYGDKTVFLCYGCAESFSFKCTHWNLRSINTIVAEIVGLFYHNCTRMFLLPLTIFTFLCIFLILLFMIHSCTSFQRKRLSFYSLSKLADPLKLLSFLADQHHDSTPVCNNHFSPFNQFTLEIIKSRPPYYGQVHKVYQKWKVLLADVFTMKHTNLRWRLCIDKVVVFFSRRVAPSWWLPFWDHMTNWIL